MNKVNLLQVTRTNNEPGHQNIANSSSNNVENMFVKRAPITPLPPIENESCHTDAATVNGMLHPDVVTEDAWQEKALLQSHFNKSNDCSLNALNNYPLSDHDKKLASSRTIRIWRTLFHFMSLTSLHGFPHIVGSKRSYFRITYWLIVLLVALSLMLWAVIKVSMLYAQSNTILVTKPSINRRLQFPSVTICNVNLYRKSVFSNHISNLDDLVVFLNTISEAPFLAKKDNNSDHLEEFKKNYGNLFSAENSIFYYNNSGHQIKQMLYVCKFAGEHCDSSHFIQISTINGNCYVFNSGRNLYSDGNSYHHGLELILSAEEYEYFVAESDSIGFNVYINYEDGFPYFSSQGLSVSTGQSTQIVLNKVDYKLLSSGGKCSDKLSLKYFKSYSHQSCIAECITDRIVSMCKCKPHFLPGPADVCKFKNPCWYENLTALYSVEQCNCPNPCELTIYEKTLSHAKFPAHHYTSVINRSRIVSKLPFPEFVTGTTTGENNTDIHHLNDNFTESFVTKNYAKIRIYYDDLVTITMEEYLEYSTPQFVIDFLGYIGLFTGAGFLTIFEIIELCFGIINPSDEYTN